MTQHYLWRILKPRYASSCSQKWGWDKFGAIPNKIKELQMKINDLYDVLLGDGITEKMKGLETELENLLKNEELMWRQRARVVG